MTKKNKQLLLIEEDYQLLNAYLNGSRSRTSFDPQNAAILKEEIKKARRVKKDVIPGDVVRINSSVRIRKENDSKELELTIVTPEQADIKNRKISVMAPIGTALIGFRKGETVKWKVPAGTVSYTIIEVVN